MSDRHDRDEHYDWYPTDNSAKPADDLGGTGPRSSPTLKEPLENIYLLSGIPRSIPRVDLYGRKPVGDLPHARGYRNGFLGEANDALNINICLFSVPILIYEAAKVIRKPTHGQSMITSIVLKNGYGVAASFGILAGLSMAGFEYRRFELLKRKPGWTQEDEDARKEKNASIWSAVGAVAGFLIAWDWRQPQEFFGSKITLQPPRLSFSRRLAFGLGGACTMANGLNSVNWNWRMINKKSPPLSSGDEQPPIKSVELKRHDMFPVGVLPHAKGFQNGFLGEMDDAAEAGALYMSIDIAESLCLTGLKGKRIDFSALFRSSRDNIFFWISHQKLLRYRSSVNHPGSAFHSRKRLSQIPGLSRCTRAGTEGCR